MQIMSTPAILPTLKTTNRSKVVHSSTQMNLRASHFAVLPDLVEAQTPPQILTVTIYPQLDEPHPYPYYISSEVYLDDSDDDEIMVKLDEETLESFLLDTHLSKQFLNELIDDLLLEDIKKTARTFTRKRAAPHFSVDPNASNLQQSSLVMHDKRETNEDMVLVKYFEEEMLPAVDILSQLIQLQALENYAKSLNDSDIQQLSKEASVLWIDPTTEQAIRKRVHQTIDEKKLVKSDNWPNVRENVAEFKHMKINIYILIYNRLWTEVVTQENAGLRGIKQQIMCNAAWRYFFPRILENAEHHMKP